MSHGHLKHLRGQPRGAVNYRASAFMPHLSSMSRKPKSPSKTRSTHEHSGRPCRLLTPLKPPT